MPDLSRLGDLLCHPRKPDHATCLGASGPVNWRQFCELVADWQSTLCESRGQILALYSEDTLNFAAALLAIWQSGKTALLPGDCLPATLAAIETSVDGFAGDFPASCQPLKAASGRVDRPQFIAVDPQTSAFLVCTSGSTGTPKKVRFNLSQMDSELAIHEQLWGPDIGAAHIVGTASHQHLYGLIFRVLWPLASGRPFSSRTALYLEEVVAASARWPSIAVITTPSHLSRLPTTIDWQAFRPHCRAVFSSAAPLKRDDSLAARAQFGVAITEIFGSSETSGIAWRRQDQSDYWQAFPGIRVRAQHADDALQIRSPVLASDDWYTTSDRIEQLDDSRFRVLGRLDQIAKIEGKRVSLARLQSLLQEHPWLEQVKPVVLQERRTEIAVVACLTEAGREVLQRLGKPGLIRELRATLGDHFDRQVIPRRWRFVDNLPSNMQGKITQALLLQLFAEKPAASPRLPEVLSQHVLDPSRVQLELHIAPQIVYFQGHFNGAPILPGVVQIHWAEHFARLYFKQQLTGRESFSQLQAIKFQQVIQPDRSVTLELSLNTAGKLGFRYYSAEEAFSSGRLVFDNACPSTR